MQITNEVCLNPSKVHKKFHRDVLGKGQSPRRELMRTRAAAVLQGPAVSVGRAMSSVTSAFLRELPGLFWFVGIFLPVALLLLLLIACFMMELTEVHRTPAQFPDRQCKCKIGHSPYRRMKRA
uniref:small leucine-rich protein 1 n=1 Tax=Jaculus jaculus TaxID=51337 RepID=UPI001E1B2869|nr:small leucine-rich protein 1 [Jaculus jaculus]